MKSTDEKSPAPIRHLASIMASLNKEKANMLDHVLDPTEGSKNNKSEPLKSLKTKTTGLNNKKPIISEKLNGEIDSVSDNKGLKVVNRARSRSKSPRGKSPEKGTEMEKKKEGCKNLVKNNKKDVKKPKISPNKAKSNEINKQPKKHSETSENINNKTKTKNAKKRKVDKSDKPRTDQLEDEIEPAVKKSKSGPDANDDNLSSDITPTKPKRKYIKKDKRVNENDSIESSELTMLKTKSNKKVSKKKNTDLAVKTSHLVDATALQNGMLSSIDSHNLSLSPPDIVIVPPKKMNKKSVKKALKLDGVKLGTKKSASNTSQDVGNVCDLEDSDTMDYPVENANVGIAKNVAEANLRGKKVVKIDDIEITELSDLNSSRESGDENIIDNCVVEKPKALVEESIQPSQTTSEVNPKGELSVDDKKKEHGIEAVINGEKVFLCDQTGCKYKGKSKVLLRKHLNHHGIYHCAHCEFVGYNYPDLETHMIANHPQRWGRKKCKKCMRYIPGEEFEAHDSTCEGIKIVTCEICGKEFKFENVLHEHIKKMHNHNCQLCEFVGDSKQILSHHMSQVHPKKKVDKHRCVHCEKTFSNKKLLTEHNKSEHGIQPKSPKLSALNPSTTPPHAIHMSSPPTFAPVKDDIAVIKSSPSKGSENFAQKPFNIPEQYTRQPEIQSLLTQFENNFGKDCLNSEETQSETVTPSCSVSGFVSMPTSRQHSRAVVGDNDKTDTLQQSLYTDENRFLLSASKNNCVSDSVTLNNPMTNINYQTSTFNRDHAANMDRNSAGDEKLTTDNSNLKFASSQFNPSSHYSDNMLTESTQHLPPTDLDPSSMATPCASLPKPMTEANKQTQNAVDQMLPSLLEERPFACQKCPKRFKDQKTLNGHQNVHNKELNFKCEVETCQIAFKTNRLLTFHKKTVHDIAPGVPTFACEHPDCNLVFKKKGQLRKHEVVHTGERRYICEWEGCQKAFRHNANLKIHHLLHTGEKPIKCKFCEFACRQKSSLIHHMKTKHKEVGWPPSKGDLLDLNIVNTPTDINTDVLKQETELNDSFDSKSDFDNSFEGENSGINLAKDELASSHQAVESVKQEEVSTAPSYPKTLSTPTKAMVKAMAPGFKLNSPGLDKINPISPMAPAQGGNFIKADIYDFDEDDSVTTLPVSLSKKLEKGPVKSPGRPPFIPTGSTFDHSEAMQPINLSVDAKEENMVKPKKKRATPKKKKNNDSTRSSSSFEQLDTTGSSGLSTSIDSSFDHSMDQTTNTQLGETTQSHEYSSQGYRVDASIVPPTDTDGNVSRNKLSDIAAEVAEAASGVRSQGSSIDRCSDDIVEEHVSENVPMSTSSSAPSSLPQNEDLDSQEPVASLPSQPEPYPDPHHDQMSSELHSSEESTPHSHHMSQVHHMPPKEQHSHDSDVYNESGEERHLLHDSRHDVSDIPQDVEDLALQRSLPPVSPNSAMHDLHSTSKSSRDPAFDLPHDIDPEEAAKLLEGHDSAFHEGGQKNSIDSHEVPVIMSSNQVAQSKEDYLPPSPPSHNNSIHHEHEPADGQYASYTPYAHHADYNQMHDVGAHDKGRSNEPENYADPSQRRPSSSYVPDFLASGLGGSASGIGPPSVSSSYSSPGYSVPSQNQADLPTYGAAPPAANLPHYPPLSSSVPYLSSPPTSSSYPTTTSAGSTISSYPPVKTTSYNSESQSERVPSVSDTRPASGGTTSVTSSTFSTSTYSTPGSRELFGHYFQDTNLPLPHITGQPQDPRSALPGYPSQQSSLQALQRSSADFLQRASAGTLPGMNYPGVSESLARLSQTGSQQPWIGHDDRTRSWAQPSPILMPPELETAASRNFSASSSRPEYPSLDTASKRTESSFPPVPSQSLQSATERYSEYMGSVGGAGHFNPSSNYSKALPPVVAGPTKQLEEAYRHSAAQHMTDYRSLSQGPPSVTDMYSRMGMNPPLTLDKYYPYSRDAMYRSQHIGSATNPFMPQTSTAQMPPYADRDYAARNPYAQDSAYSKYLPGANLTQPIPGLNAAPGDYFQARPGAPDPYDPYRRSVIHNMMSRFY